MKSLKKYIPLLFLILVVLSSGCMTEGIVKVITEIKDTIGTIAYKDSPYRKNYLLTEKWNHSIFIPCPNAYNLDLIFNQEIKEQLRPQIELAVNRVMVKSLTDNDVLLHLNSIDEKHLEYAFYIDHFESVKLYSGNEFPYVDIRCEILIDSHVMLNSLILIPSQDVRDTINQEGIQGISWKPNNGGEDPFEKQRTVTNERIQNELKILNSHALSDPKMESAYFGWGYVIDALFRETNNFIRSAHQKPNMLMSVIDANVRERNGMFRAGSGYLKNEPSVSISMWENIPDVITQSKGIDIIKSYNLGLAHFIHATLIFDHSKDAALEEIKSADEYLPEAINRDYQNESHLYWLTKYFERELEDDVRRTN